MSTLRTFGETSVHIKGKLIEAGTLNVGGRGLLLEVGGEFVTIEGLTKEECEVLTPKLGQSVHIYVRAHPNWSEP